MTGLNMDRVKLEMQRSQGPFLWVVTIVVLGVIGAYVVVSNLTGNFPFANQYQVRIAVPDASGIAPGRQDVKLAGVRIGVVKDSKLVDGRAVLTLGIDREFAPLYKDANLRIRPNTPLEDLYVSVENRGTPGTGKLTSDTILPVQQTQTAVKVSRVLNVFRPDTREAMATVLDELSRGTSDNGAQLRAAFVQAAPFLEVADRTTDVIDQRRPLVRRAMSNFSRLTVAIGGADEQLVALVRGGSATLGELATNDARFADTLRELPPTMTAARSAFSNLRAAEDDLDPALRALLRVATNLRSGLGALGDVASAARPALGQLTPAFSRLRPFAQQLRPTASALEGAFERLRPQAPALNRITQLVAGCTADIGGFFNNTISVFKFYDGFGSWPRGFTTLDESSIGGTGTATLKQLEPCTGPVK